MTTTPTTDPSSTPAEHGSVAVVIVNWNGADVIRTCLEAMRAQTLAPRRVVVVDNGSEDGSAQIVADEFPEAALLQLNGNTGFARGNNLGINHALKLNPEIEFIALLNNDTRAQPAWLAELVAGLDARPAFGMAAGKLLCWDGEHLPETIDTAGDLFYQHGLAGKRGHGEPAGAYADAEEIFGACAGAALYRVAMLNEIGLLDEEFFAYNEDVDLDLRARLAGWRCVYVPGAEVWHRVSFSAKPFSDRVLYWAKRNSAWVLVKDVPWQILLRHALPIIGYNVLSDLKWILKGRWRPILRGRLHAVAGIPKMLRARRAIQRSRTIGWRDLDAWITRQTPWCESLRRNVRNALSPRRASPEQR